MLLAALLFGKNVETFFLLKRLTGVASRGGIVEITIVVVEIYEVRFWWKRLVGRSTCRDDCGYILMGANREPSYLGGD